MYGMHYKGHTVPDADFSVIDVHLQNGQVDF